MNESISFIARFFTLININRIKIPGELHTKHLCISTFNFKSYPTKTKTARDCWSNGDGGDKDDEVDNQSARVHNNLILYLILPGFSNFKEIFSTIINKDTNESKYTHLNRKYYCDADQFSCGHNGIISFTKMIMTHTEIINRTIFMYFLFYSTNKLSTCNIQVFGVL